MLTFKFVFKPSVMQKKLIKHCRQEKQWILYLVIWGVINLGVGMVLVPGSNPVLFGAGLSLTALGFFHLVIGLTEFNIYNRLSGLTANGQEKELTTRLTGQLAKMHQRRTAESIFLIASLFVAVTGALLDWEPITVGCSVSVSVSMAFSYVWWLMKQWRLGIALGIE